MYTFVISYSVVIDITLVMVRKQHNLTRWVVPTVAQLRGPLKNNDVDEQRLIGLHQDVSNESVKVVEKEFGETNAVHGDWLVVHRKKRNKRVNYGLGKSLSN